MSRNGASPGLTLSPVGIVKSEAGEWGRARVLVEARQAMNRETSHPRNEDNHDNDSHHQFSTLKPAFLSTFIPASSVRAAGDVVVLPRCSRFPFGRIDQTADFPGRSKRQSLISLRSATRSGVSALSPSPIQAVLHL